MIHHSRWYEWGFRWKELFTLILEQDSFASVSFLLSFSAFSKSAIPFISYLIYTVFLVYLPYCAWFFFFFLGSSFTLYALKIQLQSWEYSRNTITVNSSTVGLRQFQFDSIRISDSIGVGNDASLNGKLLIIIRIIESVLWTIID